MTEWHWAIPPAPQGMAGRRPPCAGHAGLAAWDGRGQHLCRVCLNCGYGWTEACAGRTAAPPGTPVPPAASAGLFSFAACVASTGAGSFLSPLLSGAALVAAWLAVTVAVSLAVAAGYAAAGGGTGKGWRR
jgi:hypothetical protein